MFFLKMIKKVVLMLQTDISPNQIAWGFALGAVLGLVPNLLIKIVLFTVIMLFRVNITAALISCSLYAILSFMLDPLFDVVGYFVLNLEFLTPFYTRLYNMPVVPFTHFNNTIVMGSFIVGLILFIPNGILAKKGLVYYRTNYRDKVSKWKIVKLLNAAINTTKIVNIVK